MLSDPGRVETRGGLHWLYSTLGFTTTLSFLIFLSLCVLELVVISLCVWMVSIYNLARFSQHARLQHLATRLMENFLHQPYVWFLNRNRRT